MNKTPIKSEKKKLKRISIALLDAIKSELYYTSWKINFDLR